MDHRLPTHITPEKYSILLAPDLEAFTFAGEETILLTVLQPTKEITMHSAELSVLTAKLVDGATGQEGIITYDTERERVTFTFPEEVTPGQKELVLTFSGILNDRMRGFYRSKYEVDGQTLHMAVTQLESTDARRVFPSFDEPSHKAVFEVSLRIPQDHTAISNTIEEVVEEHEGEYKLVKFAPTPRMSSYLLAALVGKFEKVETTTPEGILVRVFTTPGKHEQAQFALETASKMLSFYNDYFGFDYPLPVCDLIAVPDFDAGAMENWGAVTFRETALLIDPQNSSLANKQRVALVVAHELAHMWFGNLVTMEWWTHLWLNEGFACYIEYLAIAAIFPEWEIWDQFIAMEHNDALSLDGLKNTHPIEVEVKHPSEIVEIFDQVSYAKGASIIHMLATYLGKDVFREGLRSYLKKHAYQNAKTEDLWGAFEEVSGQPVTEIMHTWTSKPGYPVISVDTNDGMLELSQKRFFSSPLSRKENNDTTLWQVPLTIRSEEKEEEILLTNETLSIQRPSGWVKVNAGEASFARVAYEPTLLTELEKPIIEKTLGTRDRLGIIRDAFDLSYAGDMDAPEALKITKSFVEETEYVVWLEIAGQLQRIKGLLGADEQIVADFNKFGKQLFRQIAEKMGWEKRPNESQTQVLLRSIALHQLGSFEDPATREIARKMFDDFVEHQTPIDPDIRGVVYALVADKGGKKEFEIFTDLYRKESLHQEKDRIGRAITSFENPEILEKVRTWILSDDVRTQDKTRLIYVLFMNPYARKATWEFVKTHWDYFFNQFKGSHGMSRLVEGVGELTSEKDALDIAAFFTAHPTPEVARTIEQVQETIRSRADWIAREKEKIADYLKTS